MTHYISTNGLALIKRFEGCSLKAYKCFSTEKYYTIGYGHYGKDVKKEMVITQTEAEKILLKDVKRFEDLVNAYDKSYHWNQNEFDSLVSFAFNIGGIKQITKNGTRTKKEIANAMVKYCNSAGKKIPALETRRKAEASLFRTPTANVDLTEIAKEVIKEKWGNGQARKKRLANAGYDYNEVQKIVNSLLK